MTQMFCAATFVQQHLSQMLLYCAIDIARHACTCSIVGYAYAKKTEYNMNEAEDIIWEHDEDLNVSSIYKDTYIRTHI